MKPLIRRVLLLLVLLVPPTSAQTISTDSAARLVARADSIWSASRTPEGQRLAASLYRAGASAFGELGNRAAEAEALTGLARSFAGRPPRSDSASHYLHRAIALWRAAGDRRGEARSLAAVGQALATQLARDQAANDSGVGYLVQAVGILRDLGADSLALSHLLTVGSIRSSSVRLFMNPSMAEATLGFLRAADSLALRLKLVESAAQVAELKAEVFAEGLQRHDSALFYLRSAVELVERGTAADSIKASRTSRLLNSVGLAYSRLGLVDSARTAFHRSGLLGAYMNLAGLFTSYGLSDSALHYARFLVSRYRSLPKRSSLDSILSTQGLIFLAHSLRRAGRLDSAIHYAHEVIRGASVGFLARSMGPLFTTQAQSTLGLAFAGLGQLDSALHYFRAQTAGRPVTQSGPSPSLLINLGAAHRLTGNPDSALAYFRQGLLVARDRRNRRAEANALSHLASVHQSQNHALAAIAYLDSAAAVRREAGIQLLDLSGAPGLEEDELASPDRPDMTTRTPIVRILPLTFSSTDSSRVTLAVAASDRGAGILDVRLYDNGAPVGTSVRGVGVTVQRCPTAAVCFELGLTPGRHTLEAAATARDGTEGARAVRVVTVPGIRRNGTLYILGIGIDEYENPAYRLRFARKDLRAVLDSLRLGSVGAFQTSPVIESLVDRAATRDSIEARLLRLAQRMQPEDVFVLYYAGHGKETTVGAGTSFYLVPADVRDMLDPVALASRGISSARLLELLRNLPARQKLLIIDACQSGGVASAYGWQDPARGALNQLAVGAGTWILAASRPQELAAESPQLGHGVFTYAVLRALGSDGRSERREISTASLILEVNALLPTLSLRARTPAQRPVLVAVGENFTVGVR